MSLKPELILEVPELTEEVARAAFPKGNPYLTLRDNLGTILGVFAYPPTRFNPAFRLRVLTGLEIVPILAPSPLCQSVPGSF
mgnify:CR=1 FL=1